VYVEKLAGRTHAVGGIYVAAMLLVEVHAPVVVVVGPELGEVVEIAAFGVEHLAEETLLGHVEGVHLKEVVNAVLKHHAVELLLLGLVDKRPDFLEAGGSGHLDSGVLAVVHCVEGHGSVCLPVGDNIHEVYVVTLAELFPGVL
jgi:hypothetical protein